jgi:hypothetical protein
MSLPAALGVLALTGAAQADEEKIAVKELPKAVVKAVKAKFPGAKIKEAAEEEDDEGETTYEVSLEFKGHSYDVALEPDGEIVEIEKEISSEELPKAVQKALAASHPKAKIEKAEVVTKEGEAPYYELLITSEVAFTAKGKPVVSSTKEKEEDEEKATAKAKKGKKAEKEEDENDDAEKGSKAKKGKKAEKEEDENDDAKKGPKAKKSKKAEKEEDEDDDAKKGPKARKGKKAEKEEDENDDKR